MSISGAKMTALQYLVTQTALYLFSRATDGRLILLCHILERVARTQHHKAQLRYLRQLVEDHHPAIGLLHRMMALNPSARRSIINSQKEGDPLWTSDADLPAKAAGQPASLRPTCGYCWYRPTANGSRATRRIRGG